MVAYGSPWHLSTDRLMFSFRSEESTSRDMTYRLEGHQQTPGKSKYNISQGNYSIRKIQTTTGTRVSFGRLDKLDETVVISEPSHSFEWDVQVTDDGYM